MENSRKRIIESLCVLEEAIVVARITKYPDAESIVKTRDFLMNKAKITDAELSEYQINRRVETFKKGE